MSMHLAAVYGLRESWKKAEAALERTLAIFDANQMQEEQYAEVYSQLGEVYMKTQRYEEGEKACRRALELFRKHPPSRETRAHIGLCMQNLGLIKAKLEQLEEAERFLEKAVEIFSRTFESAIDPITVTASVRLAAVRLDRQDVPGAQAVLVPLAEAVQRLAPGRAGVPYLNLLVTIYTDRQLHEHAEPLLRRCIQLLEPPQDRRDRILVLSLRFDLVCLLRESGRAAEADALQEQLRSAFSQEKAEPPLASSRYLRSVEAGIGGESKQYELVLEVKHRHPIGRVPQPSLAPGTFLECVFENPGAPNSPLSQSLLLDETILANRRITFQSAPLAALPEGPLLARVFVYSGPDKALLLGEHHQFCSPPLDAKAESTEGATKTRKKAVKFADDT